MPKSLTFLLFYTNIKKHILKKERMVPMKKLAPSVTQRDKKGRKFMNTVGAAYNKAGLSEEEAENINKTPGLTDLVANFIAQNRLSKTHTSNKPPFSSSSALDCSDLIGIL
jgi:hypothetical protein